MSHDASSKTLEKEKSRMEETDRLESRQQQQQQQHIQLHGNIIMQLLIGRRMACDSLTVVALAQVE